MINITKHIEQHEGMCERMGILPILHSRDISIIVWRITRDDIFYTLNEGFLGSNTLPSRIRTATKEQIISTQYGK